MDRTPYDLSIDALDMHSDPSVFCRFDKFNLKYNPLGKSRLREIFLKTDNQIQGRYFAEVTAELFDDPNPKPSPSPSPNPPHPPPGDSGALRRSGRVQVPKG